MYALIIVIIILLFSLLAPDIKTNVSGKDKKKDEMISTEVQAIAGLNIENIPVATQSPKVIPSPEPTMEHSMEPTPTPTQKTAAVKKKKPKPPLLDIPLSKKLQRYIFKQCRYDKNLYLIVISVIKTESDFDADTIGIDGHDKGLMQVRDCNLEYLNEQFGNVDLMNPYDNVKCGIHILRNYYDKYEYINLMTMAYNCGEAGARKLWRREIYSTEYSRKVTEYYKSFKEKAGE